MKGLALMAECTPFVGSGHAMELLNLTRHLRGIPWIAYLSDETPPHILRRFGGRADTVEDFSPELLSRMAPALHRSGHRAVLLNFMKVSSGQLAALRHRRLKTALLTVSGPRPKHCDLWFNLNADPRHMILDPRYAALARRPRKHKGPVRELLILMGGTDRSGTTLVLMRALAGALPGTRIHVVAGPNFAHPARLRDLKSPDFRVHWNPTDLPGLMRRCDAAFTFGSDTSLELACAGTPTILLHEAPHEERQARFLARKGCGLFLGPKSAATPRRLAAALRRMDDPAFRDRCARAGQKLVDGRGGERIAAAVRRLLK